MKYGEDAMVPIPQFFTAPPFSYPWVFLKDGFSISEKSADNGTSVFNEILRVPC
jgi:hypothetical protein